jgi:hypothetical protein
MRRFVDEGFVVDDGLAFEPLPGGFLLSGEVECLGHIVLEVTKVLTIVGGTTRDPVVQTTSYTYNARIRGVGNILRYCSAHADHNSDHHVHRYDVVRGDRRGTTTLHGAPGWPTLGDVMAEIRDWYFSNQAAVDRLASASGPEDPRDESDD